MSSNSQKTSQKWKIWRSRQHTSRNLKVHGQLLNILSPSSPKQDMEWGMYTRRLARTKDSSLSYQKKKLLCVTTVERNYPLIFRQERLCVDQIATLRIIIFIEQTIEWQTFYSGPPTLGNPQTLWNPISTPVWIWNLKRNITKSVLVLCKDGGIKSPTQTCGKSPNSNQ